MSATACAHDRTCDDVRDLVYRFLSGDSDVCADFVRPGEFQIGHCSPAIPPGAPNPRLPSWRFVDVEEHSQRCRTRPEHDDGVKAGLGDTGPVHAWFWVSEWPEQRSAIVHCPSIFRDASIPWHAISRAISASISASGRRASIYRRLGALDPLWVVDVALERGDADNAGAAMLACIGVDHDLVTVDVRAHARDMVLSLLLWRLRQLDRSREDPERVAEIRALVALEHRALQNPCDPNGTCETCDQPADFVLPLLSTCMWTHLCRSCFVAGRYLSDEFSEFAREFLDRGRPWTEGKSQPSPLPDGAAPHPQTFDALFGSRDG